MHRKTDENINNPNSILKTVNLNLFQSQDFINDLFNNLNEVIAILSHENEIIFLSPNSNRILGSSEKMFKTKWVKLILKGKKIPNTDIIHSAHNPDSQITLINSKSRAYFEIRVNENKENFRYFSVNKKPAMGGKYTIVFIRDITAYKNKSEAENESGQILNAILTATPIGLGMIKDDKFIWSNEALMRILEINSLNDSTTLNNLKIKIASGQKSVRSLFQILSEFDFGEISFQFQKSNGKVTECLLLSCPVDINDLSKGKVIAIADINEQKIVEDELKKSQKQLRELALHIENIREQEKKRISFEIHDELGYALTALKLDLTWLKNKNKNLSPGTSERIKSMTELIDSTIKRIRTICTELRPSILDHFGLAAAIEWQVKEFQKRTGIISKLYIDDGSAVIQEKYSVMIFRILQEALTNITRHSQANEVIISYILKNNILELCINDNGVGIQINDYGSIKTFGLLSMRERANSIGGILEIKGKKGKGTSIRLKVKIPDKDIRYD